MRKPGKAETEFVFKVDKLTKQLKRKYPGLFTVFNTDRLKGKVVSVTVFLQEPVNSWAATQTHVPKLKAAEEAGLSSELVDVNASYRLTPKRAKKPHPNLTKKRKAWSAGKMRMV